MRYESSGTDSATRAQRRDITILFADLAGSTRLSRSLEPETYHRIVNAFLEHCAARIGDAGGYVARFMGDGVLAYFGFPQAHEDDPVRAISAAMAIQDGCSRLASGAELAARCGIAAGSTIIGTAIGSDGAREVPVFGDVANLAARLQGAARPGRILVASEVAERATTRFRFSRSGPLQLNGFPEVTHGWEVEEQRTLQRRSWSPAAPSGRMIGREQESALLEAAWQRACAGYGSAILVEGAAGLGKTRLVEHCMAGLAGHSVRSVAADPLRIHTPFDLITRLFDDLLAGGEVAVGVDGAVGGGDALVDGESAGEERALALARFVLDRLIVPSVLIVEDFHWADRSSREVVAAIASALAERSVLMIVTARPMVEAFAPPHCQIVSLTPLTDTETVALIEGAVAGSLPTADLSLVVKRSGGVPLFARELARLAAVGPVGAASRTIPETLAGLLLVRLTALGVTMELAQCAAIFGADAPVAAVEALARRRGVDIGAGLAVLQREGIAFVSGSPPTLRFQHDLFREAALETLLSVDSKDLYRGAAEILEAGSVGFVPDSALAEFWAKAGDVRRALEAIQGALTDARRQRAWPEIRQLAERALALLRQLPQEERGLRRELDFQSLLSEALQITTGYSSPATRAATANTRRLAARAGEIYQSVTSVSGQWMAASSAGDYRRAQEIAAHALSLARLHGGDEALAAAHMIDMTTRYRMGDLTGAEATFSSGRAFFDCASFVARAGAIPQTFGNAALVAVLSGDSVGARQRCAHALRAARRQAGAYDRCFAAYMVAMVEILLGADRIAVALGENALRLAETLGFPQFVATARIVIGRARAGLGDVDAGILLLREGLDAMSDTHARNAQTLYLTWLAEAALSGGKLDVVLDATQAALDINPDELFYRPETLRIRALALLGKGAVGEAELALKEGAALANSMQASWFVDRMRPLQVRFTSG